MTGPGPEVNEASEDIDTKAHELAEKVAKGTDLQRQDAFSKIKQTNNLSQEELIEMLIIANMFTLTKKLTDKQGSTISKKDSMTTYRHLINRNWPSIYPEEADGLLEIGTKGMKIDNVKTEFKRKFKEIQTRKKAQIKKSLLVK